MAELSERRVAFTFTDESLAEVEQMELDGKFTGAYGAVIDHALAQMARTGVAEITMRNPETDEERVVRIPGARSYTIAPGPIHRPFQRQGVCPCCRRSF